VYVAAGRRQAYEVPRREAGRQALRRMLQRYGGSGAPALARVRACRASAYTRRVEGSGSGRYGAPRVWPRASRRKGRRVMVLQASGEGGRQAAKVRRRSGEVVEVVKEVGSGAAWRLRGM